MEFYYCHMIIEPAFSVYEYLGKLEYLLNCSWEEFWSSERPNYWIKLYQMRSAGEGLPLKHRDQISCKAIEAYMQNLITSSELKELLTFNRDLNPHFEVEGTYDPSSLSITEKYAFHVQKKSVSVYEIIQKKYNLNCSYRDTLMQVSDSDVVSLLNNNHTEEFDPYCGRAWFMINHIYGYFAYNFSRFIIQSLLLLTLLLTIQQAIKTEKNQYLSVFLLYFPIMLICCIGVLDLIWINFFMLEPGKCQKAFFRSSLDLQCNPKGRFGIKYSYVNNIPHIEYTLYEGSLIRLDLSNHENNLWLYELPHKNQGYNLWFNQSDRLFDGTMATSKYSECESDSREFYLLPFQHHPTQFCTSFFCEYVRYEKGWNVKPKMGRCSLEIDEPSSIKSEILAGYINFMKLNKRNFPHVLVKPKYFKRAQQWSEEAHNFLYTLRESESLHVCFNMVHEEKKVIRKVETRMRTFRKIVKTYEEVEFDYPPDVYKVYFEAKAQGYNPTQIRNALQEEHSYIKAKDIKYIEKDSEGRPEGWWNEPQFDEKTERKNVTEPFETVTEEIVAVIDPSKTVKKVVEVAKISTRQMDKRVDQLIELELKKLKKLPKGETSPYIKRLRKYKSAKQFYASRKKKNLRRKKTYRETERYLEPLPQDKTPVLRALNDLRDEVLHIYNDRIKGKNIGALNVPEPYHRLYLLYINSYTNSLDTLSLKYRRTGRKFRKMYKLLLN